MTFLIISATSQACLRTRRCIRDYGPIFRISRRAVLTQFEGQICLHLAGSTGWTGWIPENELSIQIEEQGDRREVLRTIPVSGSYRHRAAQN